MFVWRRLKKMQRSQCDTHKEYQTRLPIFSALVGMYREESHTYYLHLSLVISLIAIVFGGIHGAAWNFEFPSHAEKMIWHTSTSLIVIIPCILFTSTLYMWLCVKNYCSSLGILFKIAIYAQKAMIQVIPLYLFARIIILVEAFIALRNLPEAAYVQVEWSKLIPHI